MGADIGPIPFRRDGAARILGIDAMIGFKGAPTGILVGLVFAGLAWFITGMAGAAVIFGVVFGGVIYLVTRYRILYGKPAADGVGGSSDGDEDTTWSYDSSSSAWMSSTSSDPTPSDDACADSGSDSGSDDGGSCDSGGGDSGGGGGD